MAALAIPATLHLIQKQDCSGRQRRGRRRTSLSGARWALAAAAAVASTSAVVVPREFAAVTRASWPPRVYAGKQLVCGPVFGTWCSTPVGGMRYRTTVPCHAEPQGFRFRYTPGTGRVSFSTEDDVRISLGNVSAGGPVAYLAEPDRIVRASWPSDGDESPVQVEGPGRYVLPMPAVHLLGLTWQARVRWRASFDAEAGALRISSDGVDLGLTGPAADAFRDAFEMAIGGRVKDISEGNDGELSATIRMDVRGRLPPPLTILFPESALREASAEVVRLTQGFAIKELRSRIAADYKAWASRS